MLKALEIFNQQQDFCAYTIEMYGRQSFVVLFYHMGNEHETYQYLEQTDCSDDLQYGAAEG